MQFRGRSFLDADDAIAWHEHHDADVRGVDAEVLWKRRHAHFLASSGLARESLHEGVELH